MPRRAHPIVHADVEIGEHENRGLQAFGNIEGLHSQIEALLGICRKQQHMPRIAVRSIGAQHEVRLLGARRHAGGRPDPLHIENDARHLGVVSQADEFVHQRYARPAGRCECTRPVPRRTEHHSDGGQFVLGLQNGEVALAGLGVDAITLAEAFERIHQRG